jgi:hypothetical protein
MQPERKKSTINGSEQRQVILQKIQDSLRKAQAQAKRLSNLNSRFTLIVLISSVLATLGTSLPAFFGQPMAGSWRITCAAAAVLTACATLFTGLQKQLSTHDRLARAIACAGKLSALELAITVSERDPAEVAKEYEEVVTDFQDFII